jgi:hypothetical protein
MGIRRCTAGYGQNRNTKDKRRGRGVHTTQDCDCDLQLPIARAPLFGRSRSRRHCALMAQAGDLFTNEQGLVLLLLLVVPMDNNNKRGERRGGELCWCAWVNPPPPATKAGGPAELWSARSCRSSLRRSSLVLEWEKMRQLNCRHECRHRERMPLKCPMASAEHPPCAHL